MDKSRFIICRAAAGSGKTYTLVRNYLQLAFSAKEGELASRFSRILAITFTNKAANEMKERILRELDNIAAHGTEAAMGRDLAEEMHLDDSTIRRYAATVLQAILHNYSDFAVMTIDSFVHHIVRTFAHDLNLPMNFNVYIDNTDLIQKAIDELMALVGCEGQEGLTEVLCDYAESQMTEGKSFMIEQDLAKKAEELFKEHTPEFLGKLEHLNPDQFKLIHKQLIAENRDYENRLAALGEAAVEAYTSAGLCDEDFFRGRNGVASYFHKTASGESVAPNSWAMQFLEGDKLGGSKTSKAALAQIESIKPRLQELHQGITALREAEERTYFTRKLLLKSLYELALLNKLGELVGQYSRENEIVHISEFNKRISRVVQEEPAPFIYERIGNRYYNYLIDEFQDTSRMQWQNLVPLVENGVGAGHTSLVVGDGKQAIYRFRQGDVEQFVSLPHVDSPLHGQLLEQPGVSHPTRLDRNFRSARTVVEFNNDFFEWAVRNRFPDNEELHQIYLGDSEDPDLAQKVTKEGGYVQIGFWDCPKEHEVLWKEMLADIRDLREEKGYDYRDITILARKNRVLSEISTFLTQNEIPVVSSESLLLSQSLVVMMMRNLLQYLIDDTDRIAAARVLMYLYSLGKTKKHYDDAFIHNLKRIDLDEIAQQEGLGLNCQKLRSLGLYDCCEEALRMLDLNGIETAYTASWLNAVARYASNHRYDLREFLEWFDQEKDRLSTNTASDLDAVRLMTIHKAKGLESPIVLYPILTTKETNDSIWVNIDPATGLPLPASLVAPNKNEPTLFDSEYKTELLKHEMDEVNVLYVALTRSKEKLMLYCQAPPKEPSKSYISLLNSYALQSESCAEGRDGTFCWGTNTSKTVKTAEDEASKPLNRQIDKAAYPDWAERIAIAEQSAEIFGEFDESSKRRGNLMHALLATIANSDEADKALEAFISRNEVEEEDAEALTSMLHSMLKQPEIARFFSSQHGCKNECDMVWHGEVLRPDRIVTAQDETWVIDFKTGAPKVEHRIQVGRYCEAIQAMGYPSVKGYLLYLGTQKCQVVPCK